MDSKSPDKAYVQIPQVVKSRISQEHSAAQELATVHRNDREAAKRAHDYIIASDDAVFTVVDYCGPNNNSNNLQETQVALAKF